MTTSSRTELENEAIRICQELIQIPSVNYGDGKGDEKAVAAHVMKLLTEVGIEAKMYEAAPGRCNVIARIKGTDASRQYLTTCVSTQTSSLLGCKHCMSEKLRLQLPIPNSPVIRTSTAVQC